MTDAIQTITRREFVNRLMRQCGMSYSEACRAYRCMVGIFEDGVVSGSKICMGHVGAIKPLWKKPREVVMPFKVTRGRKLQKTRRIYALGGRYGFKFVLYNAFVNTHSLRWFADGGSEG